MRFVAIAALAATFWLVVATVRLMIFAPLPSRVAEPPASAPALVEPPRAPKAGGDECGLPGPYDLPPPRPEPGNPLSKIALIKGLNAVQPQVADCYRRFQIPGMAMVNIVIGKNGRVSKADVTGKFASTQTGVCVEAAVRTARFPASDGLMTPYPFQLR